MIDTLLVFGPLPTFQQPANKGMAIKQGSAEGYVTRNVHGRPAEPGPAAASEAQEQRVGVLLLCLCLILSCWLLALVSSLLYFHALLAFLDLKVFIYLYEAAYKKHKPKTKHKTQTHGGIATSV